VWIVLAAALITSEAALSAIASSAKVDARRAEMDTQTRVVALPAGKPLTIEITIGSVRIDGWDRNDAEIAIERHAPTAAHLDRLPITIDDTASRVTVRATQTDGTTDPALRTDVVVRAPYAATIGRVQVMEGRISINRLAGAVNADIRRGPIEGRDVSGTVRLECGIGSVVLTGAKLSATGLLRLRAFNGDVRLTLAERPADARIMALALNGTIKSDIPLTMRDTWGPRWGETTIGNGEPVISLDVVTGAVELRVR
jgi:DUF4097 and DUF4098 domain-containing protein YvlB